MKSDTVTYTGDFSRSASMLLNNYETHKTGPNLKTLEGAAFHTMDHVVPTMQTNSCIPFLYSISYYAYITDDPKVKFDNIRRNLIGIETFYFKVKLAFLQHKNIQAYLKALRELDRYYLTSNWFARPESFILMNILKTSVAVKDDLDTSLFYELSVKCLCVFNSEQKNDIEYLLRNIVFSSKYYPSEVLLGNLSIEQRNENLETSLSNMDDILDVYIEVLGLKNVSFIQKCFSCLILFFQNVPDLSTSCSINASTGNVIPIDWIYTPILVLYSNQQQNASDVEEERQVYIIRNCLRWILIYETYFPLLAASIDPTDKFCRLACVFLASDSLFLIKDIHDLLQSCFKNLITKRERDLNFRRDIQGKSMQNNAV